MCGGAYVNSVYATGIPDPTGTTPQSETDVVGLGPTSPSYMGCYADDLTTRAMVLTYTNNFLTIETCVWQCGTYRDFAYAGLQDGGTCFCGNSYDFYGALPENSCNKPCAGDSTRLCGGTLANSVYATA